MHIRDSCDKLNKTEEGGGEEEKVEQLFLIAGLIIAILAGSFYSSRMNRKKVHYMLLKQFGTKPEYKEYNFDEIKIFWKERKSKDCRGHIDDITWNDLSMDKVFARINTCCSSVGDQYLYRSLRTLCYEDSKLEALENKIIFVADHQDARIDIQKKLLRIGKRENNYYIPSFLNGLDHFKLSKIWIYYLLQLLLFLAIVMSILLRHTYAYAFLGIIFLVNINIYALMKGKYEINMDLMIAVQSILKISGEFAGEKDAAVFGGFRENQEVVRKLTKSLKFINGRYRRKYSADFMEVSATYITGAFLFDFVMYNRILTMLEKHLTVINQVFELLGELDMAVSAASFRRSIPMYCVPEFGEGCGISYKEMYNPLLEEPVYNDFSLNDSCIVTGSNASGKSTFIKAVAVNEILAMSIHTCAAKTARIAKAEVYTSMAIRDDLMAGESYFIREVRSLQRIVDVIDRGKLVIAVIDEILRGTNTQERIAASAAILKYLERKNCIVIVASHDVELIDLLNSDHYANYYFSEKAKNEEIVFDYKLHQGICEQRNAIKLLDHFGFPESVVEAANRYLI